MKFTISLWIGLIFKRESFAFYVGKWILFQLHHKRFPPLAVPKRTNFFFILFIHAWARSFVNIPHITKVLSTEIYNTYIILCSCTSSQINISTYWTGPHCIKRILHADLKHVHVVHDILKIRLHFKLESREISRGFCAKSTYLLCILFAVWCEFTTCRMFTIKNGKGIVQTLVMT